ncbi:MAG: hypothetical protein HFG92_09940 [Dorea sp.]|jgi:hypothetical protein|nr:hypothetical protein [Dorea sp.]MDE6830453.1 hypothetical protein [Lachnospiraceae bacterium]
MTTKQKKLTMLIAGFLIGAAASITKGMHIIDSPFLNLCLVLLNYGGMLASLFGLNYFATTYQYEKYPKESLQTVIDLNDERTRQIHTLAKAKAFDIITYVLIFLPFLLLEIKAGVPAIVIAGTAPVILGISYAFFLSKYSKEM